MIHYQRILVAIDFSPSADQIIARAIEIKKNASATLTLIHVVDHLPPLGFGEEPLIAPDWMIPEKELITAAEKSLESILKKHHLDKAEHLVTLGTASGEIVRVAEEKQCDLIIVGSHGRHGVRMLLGSTANGVLHHAKCDVLAVRVND
jgi:universal stress protein A